MNEKIFADGIMFKKPRDGAPEFVKGSLSIKVDAAVPFLQKYAKEGWVNLDLKKSQKGTLYLQLNTWEKPQKKETAGTGYEYPVNNISPSEIPF
jgi:hypothetical protein